MPDPATLKQRVAEQAAALVASGMVVGLGTGSTATLFIACLIERAAQGLDIVCIPTSERSAAQARAGGLVLVGFDAHTRIDLTVDGADEIRRDNLQLIKGLGGALLREKIVAAASDRLVIIADDSKLVDRLGGRAPVPVEVERFGWQATAARIAALGARAVLRGGGDPYVTDGGHFIVDADFGEMDDAATTDRRLRDLVGVVETGLFIGLASQALVATAGGVETVSA